MKHIKERYGEVFEGYNPTEAVRDIKNVVEALKQNVNEKVVIYGLSYG
jgi:dienelactone hydrolase